MAESYGQQAFRRAHEVAMEWLEALRPSDRRTGQGASDHSVRDLERVVGMIVLLRSAQRQPATSTTPARKQPDEGVGGVRKNRSKEPETGFPEFWGIYPRKIGKQAAVKAWNARTLDERRAAYKDVKRRIANDKDWVKKIRDGEFKLHASTYLDKERWTDEWDAPQGGSGGAANSDVPAYRCPSCGTAYATSGGYFAHLDDDHDGKEPEAK